MSLAARVLRRVYPTLFQVNFKSSSLSLTHLMSSLPKYGKLINDNVTNGFYLPIGNEEEDMAVVFYEKQYGVLNLHHTEVPVHLRGKGVGHELAKEVFDYCSARNLKVLLTCEFLQKFYQENPQYKTLVVVREKFQI